LRRRVSLGDIAAIIIWFPACLILAVALFCDILCAGLVQAGFKCRPPQGAYYVMADFSALSDLPDDEFAKWLTVEHGVASVPGSSFYHDKQLGRSLVRFAFCKKYETLKRAAERLATVRAAV